MNRHRLIAAAIGASLFFTFTGGQASASANSATDNQNEQVYIVKSGDTLWGIAKQIGLPLEALKSKNGMKDNYVHVGQKLLFSDGKTTSQPSALLKRETSYIAQMGDSLSNIAARHNLSVSQLKFWNHLSSNSVSVGQVLILTEAASKKEVQKSFAALSSRVKKMSPASIANAIMAEAKKYIGTPYLWGGNTISGFDCSGYLKYVFAKVGISIPRTAATIWNATNAVAEPKPGDMVFFETYTSGPSHLGIYLGSNKFIHACDSGVKISDMNFSFWKERYLGAKTIF